MDIWYIVSHSIIPIRTLIAGYGCTGYAFRKSFRISKHSASKWLHHIPLLTDVHNDYMRGEGPRLLTPPSAILYKSPP